MRRAAIYARISQDKTGDGLGVDRQEEDCRELARRMGWDVVDVYVDNDISAAGTKPRPAYRRMLADIDAGLVDAVVAWHTDRLYRKLTDLAEFVTVCSARGVVVSTVKAGELDLSTSTGRMIAGILGSVAAAEVDLKKERQLRQAQQEAERGAMPRGGHRPFGYADSRTKVKASEAMHIRAAVHRLLNEGASVRGVVAEWNAAGVRSTTGKLWTSHTFRRMITSARISGRREHHGVIVAAGDWPAIISPEHSDQLRDLLLDPARRTNFNPYGRRYLLTGGLAVCYRCGHGLIARAYSDRRPSYVCADPHHGLWHSHVDGSELAEDAAGRNTCGNGRLRINAEPFEEFVREAVFAVLDSSELHTALRADGGAEAATAALWADLDAARQRADKLDDDFYVTGAITDERRFRRLRAQQEQVMADVRAQIDRAQEAAGRRALPVGSDRARELWAERGLEWRRQLVGTVVEKVIVGPGVRGLNKFDHRRLTIVWRY